MANTAMLLGVGRRSRTRQGGRRQSICQKQHGQTFILASWSLKTFRLAQNHDPSILAIHPQPLIHLNRIFHHNEKLLTEKETKMTSNEGSNHPYAAAEAKRKGAGPELHITQHKGK